MRRSEEFALAVRRGARAGTPHLVAHLLLAGASDAQKRRPPMAQDPAVSRVGLVVSKAVGGAVVRTRVKRRLRALLAERLNELPAGALLVVRANPAAADATSAQLAASLDRALKRLLPAAVSA
jgi:ribonuclease P protein component